MAKKIDLEHKLLASGLLYDDTVEGNAGWNTPGWTGSPLYTSPTGVNGIHCSGTDVKLMYFHNTDDTLDLNIKNYFYSTGTTSRTLNLTLPSGNTLEWDFGYVMHLNTGESIYGNVQSGHANKINYHIYGAENMSGVA